MIDNKDDAERLAIRAQNAAMEADVNRRAEALHSAIMAQERAWRIDSREASGVLYLGIASYNILRASSAAQGHFSYDYGAYAGYDLYVVSNDPHHLRFAK